MDWGAATCSQPTGSSRPTTITAPGTAYPRLASCTTVRVTQSLERRRENARNSASTTASTALMLPRRRLLAVHSRKRFHGSTDQSAASGRSMNSTGATNPASTGNIHSTQASPRRRPVSSVGCASADPARAPRPTTNRMRRWARCSSHSSSATTASSMVASWAAATRLSIDSQAL